MKQPKPDAGPTPAPPRLIREYVVVDEDNSTAAKKLDEKKSGDNALTSRPSSLSWGPRVSAKAVLNQMSTRGPRRKTVKVRIWGRSTGNSAAATFLSAVIPIKPGGFTEAGSFDAVFDQCRCLGGEIHLRCRSVQASTDTSAPNWAASVVFSEPLASVTSVLQLLAASHSMGPVALGSFEAASATAGLQSGTVPTTATGFLKLPFKVPAGTSLNPGASSEYVGGSWFALSDSNATPAFLQIGVDALVAGTSAYDALIGVDLELRSRD